MGYKSERNRGLASLAEIEEDPRLWNRPGNNILTRFVSGMGRGIFMDIPRGLGRAAGAVGTDVAEIVKEPLGAAVRALGGDSEAMALGPAGWWTNEEGGRQSSTFEDVLKPVGGSFKRTGELAGDVMNPAEWGRVFTNPEDSDLRKAGGEFVENPFEFLLEHVGNASIAGALASQPAKLSIASSRGAITGGQAARGLRPLAGRGVRRTATEATRQAAQEGSRAARGTLFANDVVGHPYRTLGRKGYQSRPAQLFREPIDRAVGRQRAMATFGGQRGSFQFDESSVYADWNKAAKAFNEDARAGNDFRHTGRYATQLDEIAKDMQSRGIEPPEWNRGEDLVPELDPNQVALRDPEGVITKEDFPWMDEGNVGTGNRFVEENLINENIHDELAVTGADLTPGTHIHKLGSATDIAYHIAEDGSLVGMLEVNPYSGINIGVLEGHRGRGLGEQLLTELGQRNPNIDWESALKMTTTSEFGTRLQERMRQRLASGEVEINPEAQGRVDTTGASPWTTNPAPAQIPIPDRILRGPVSGILDWIDNQIAPGTTHPLTDVYNRVVDLENKYGPDYVASRAEIESATSPQRINIEDSGQSLGDLNRELWEASGETPRTTPSDTFESLGISTEPRLRDVFGSEEGSVHNPKSPLNKLPEVPEGHVRLWRGESSTRFEPGSPQRMHSAGDPSLSGRWFSSGDDLAEGAARAESYAQARVREAGGGDPVVSYIDIPESQLDSFRASQVDPGAGATQYVLPEELANQSRPGYRVGRIRRPTGEFDPATGNLERMRLRDVFGGEEGSIANPFARQGGRDPMRFGPMDLAGNELGHLKNQFFESEFGRPLSNAAREARRIASDTLNARRRGAGPIAQGAFAAIDALRGTGAAGARYALDARVTEAKVLRGLHSLARRPEGVEYANLLKRIDLGDGGGLRDRVSAGRDVATGRRAIGSNIPADKLVRNLTEVFNAAKRKAKSVDDIPNELNRILPGVDPEGLGLLILDAIEKADNLPQGVLHKAVGDYIQGDRWLSDVNWRAQQVLGESNPTPSRFRVPDEYKHLNWDNISSKYGTVLDDVLDQFTVARRGMEEAKATDNIINARSGTRIGLSADEATQFGLSERYMNDVLDTFDLDLQRDFGGNMDAAIDKLEDLTGKFFDVDLETIRAGNAPKGMKTRLRKMEKEFEQVKRQRESLLEEMDKLQSKENWTKRDWERHADLKAQSKKNLNQVITSAGRLGKLRQTVAGSLEAAPVAARNLLLYAREVAPLQIEALQGMLKDGVGDPRVINELIDDIKATPKTLDELNAAETRLMYLKDVRDISRPTPVGSAGSSTRGPALRRRGTGTDATYVNDLRTRLFSQDIEYQRFRIAKEVQDVVQRKGLSKTGSDLLQTKEFGLTPDEIANLTPGQIVDSLSQAGYKVFTPDNLFEMRRAPEGNPLEATWIREDVGNILTRGFKADGAVESFIQATYDRAQNAWKVAALPLRPAWQVNNTFGNALLTMLVGQVNPFDYGTLLRGSQEAVKMWNDGLARTIRIPLTERWIREMQDALPSMEQGQRALVQSMLDEGAITLDNSILNEITSRGLVQGDFAFLNNSQFFRTLQPHEQGLLRRTGLRQSHPRQPKNLEELGDVKLGERTRQRARNLRATGREVVDYSYHVNELVDNMHRTLIYLDQMRKGAGHSEALAMVNKALGDYNKLTEFERRWVRRVYPFWPWMRHMLEVTARSAKPDDIGRSLVFAHVTNILGEPNALEELLPEYAAGDIFLGYGEEGTPKFLSSRGMNPYLDVFDPLMQPQGRGLIRPMSPFLNVPIERITGVSNLTGREFSSPVRRADQQLPRPPMREQLFNQIPQAKAARNIYRDLTGQPLTRYGTGEPAIFPGAEADKSSLNNISQLFGANIRPMNVEDMAKREKMRLFQEAQDRARQEAKERAYNEKNARPLSDLFR